MFFFFCFLRRPGQSDERGGHVSSGVVHLLPTTRARRSSSARRGKHARKALQSAQDGRRHARSGAVCVAQTGFRVPGQPPSPPE